MIEYTYLVSDLKKVKMLYIENDLELSNQDKSCIEIALSSIGDMKTSIEDFNIKFVFDAFGSRKAFDEFEASTHILLSTRFTGNSYFMLKNFLAGCKQKGLRDKYIFNCVSVKDLRIILDVFKEEIIALDLEQNIRLYGLPTSYFNCFEKVFIT